MELEAEMKQLLGPMTAIMSAGMMVSMVRRIQDATLRQLLGRDPTALELWYYNDQLYWRNLARWHQDQVSSYQRIYGLVWGGS